MPGTLSLAGPPPATWARHPKRLPPLLHFCTRLSRICTFAHSTPPHLTAYAAPILYTRYSILSSPSLPDIVEDEHFFEYVGQEGDKLLMGRLVQVLLLEGFL
jgi:hypothetical protein